MIVTHRMGRLHICLSITPGQGLVCRRQVYYSRRYYNGQVSARGIEAHLGNIAFGATIYANHLGNHAAVLVGVFNFELLLWWRWVAVPFRFVSVRKLHNGLVCVCVFFVGLRWTWVDTFGSHILIAELKLSTTGNFNQLCARWFRKIVMYGGSGSWASNLNGAFRLSSAHATLVRQND